MGQYSWLDCLTKEQIVNNKQRNSYLLIPGEFGGGHVEEPCYDGYGHFGGRDVYEEVVRWNRDSIPELIEDVHAGRRSRFHYRDMEAAAVQFHRDGTVPAGGTTELRDIGINLACYDEDNAALKYPIKITHDPDASYEDCGPSPRDPKQGWEC